MVVYSTQVMSGLRQYISSLLMYPISLERAFEKFDNMISSLDALDTQNGNVVCNYQDLGQVILRKKYKFPYLDKYIWKDEAKRSWTFSYIQDGKGNDYVYLMKYSAFITKENNEHNTNTMNNTKKRIRLTESYLHRLIMEAINELDWKTYYDAARKGMKRVADIERENEYVQSGDAPCIAPDGTKDWWYGDRKLIPVRDKELERSERFAEKARQEFKKKYPNSETYNYPMNVRHLAPGHRGHSSDFTFSEVGNPDRDDYESYWQEVGINESIHRAIRKVLR